MMIIDQEKTYNASSQGPGFTVRMTSTISGFISLSGHSSVGLGHFSKTLHAPADNIIMISFSKFQDFGQTCHSTGRGLELYGGYQSGSEAPLWRECDEHADIESYLLESSTVTVVWPRQYNTREYIKLQFSFHHKDKPPHRLSSGLFNCSVDDYWTFRQHLHCNMKAECQDGQDETGHCPFSSPACGGWVASRNKCYRHVSKETLTKYVPYARSAHLKAAEYCASHNASVAAPTDKEDMNSLFFITDLLYNEPTVVRLMFGQLAVPNIYRRSLLTYDKLVIHHTLTARFAYQGRELCFYLISLSVHAIECALDGSLAAFIEKYYAVCEFTVHGNDMNNITSIGNNNGIRLSKTAFTYWDGNISLSTCPDGGAVHTFLSCYPHSACGHRFPDLCNFVNNMDSPQTLDDLLTSVPVFTCGDDVTRISYTLLCDFKHHCKDRSDETFCHHPSCDAFACSNGQCLSVTKRCDLVSDCFDDSDEVSCEGYKRTYKRVVATESPVLIRFDRVHFFHFKKMSPNETCPETHYRCPGEYNDCLPVYTRCNGWYDCMDHEDEEGCEGTSCPGFYRCFNSTVCVDAGHLCDGWPHCPQRDDEWLCDVTCPAQCMCLGHTFLCPQPFSANFFPQLRYLDAQGSGMKPSDFTHNHYLVYLSLSQCGLRFIPTFTMRNLQHFDLSDNSLHFINMSVLTGLLNVRTLVLRKNPLHQLIYSNYITQQDSIRTVDLSNTRLTVFDSKALRSLFSVRRLNLSFSAIHTIHLNGFRYTPKLAELYLAGNPIKVFPADVLKPLRSLDVLTSQTYKLCCKQILPSHFELILCAAPSDEISSCEDLLRSATYRCFVWLISFLAFLGNVFCLAVHACARGATSTSSFHIFVTNLSTADLLMGVYIAIIGVADSRFHGKYLFYDETWKHSVTCKVAGFLSLLSCEVSALTIWLITLDRFIVLHFPFSSVRFQRNSAGVACLITWLIGLLLASVPVLPVTAHWEFFSQTGICIPLPVTRQDFKGKYFSVGVFIIFNFILFLLIAIGQVFIYWSVQKNSLNTDSTRVSRDLTIARRLISVAVTDFVSWFPIGFCGLLALADIPIPGEVNVALAIFVLPMNSALNPYMYTFNMLMEKRRKSREATLLRCLQTHADIL